MDFQFFQIQKGRGPVVWGDFVMNNRGDLATVAGETADTQAVMARLLTNREAGQGFRLSPETGADLPRLLGNPMGADLLAKAERQANAALTADGRFPRGTAVKMIPTGEGSARIVVVTADRKGTARVLAPALSLDTVSGVTAPESSGKPKEWMWRRGDAFIMQTHRLWRAWMNQRVIWRLSPERLVTTKVTESHLDGLGLFGEPFLVYQDGYLFCSRYDEAGRVFRPRAWARPTGWTVDKQIQTISPLDAYPDLPDGVWCDEETGWNVVIKIGGETAGIFNEGAQRWQFVDVREVS